MIFNADILIVFLHFVLTNIITITKEAIQRQVISLHYNVLVITVDKRFIYNIANGTLHLLTHIN